MSELWSALVGSSSGTPSSSAKWVPKSVDSGHNFLRAALTSGHSAEDIKAYFGSKTNTAELCLGGSPDLARQSKKLAEVLAEGHDAAINVKAGASTGSDIAQWHGLRAYLANGTMTQSICPDPEPKGYDPKVAEDWITLLEATGAFDAEQVHTYAKKMHQEEHPIYTHIMSCNQSMCSFFRGIISDAHIGSKANTKSSQQYSFNPDYGLPGLIPSGGALCINHQHSMSQGDYSIATTLLAKARASTGPDTWTRKDLARLRQATLSLRTHFAQDHPLGVCGMGFHSMGDVEEIVEDTSTVVTEHDEFDEFHSNVSGGGSKSITNEAKRFAAIFRWNKDPSNDDDDEFGAFQSNVGKNMTYEDVQ